MRYPLSVIIVFLTMSGYAFAGKIYTWKDANGQVHFSSTPPPQVEVKSTGMNTNDTPGLSDNAASGKTQPNSIMQRYEKLQDKKSRKKQDDRYSKMVQDAKEQQAKRSVQINNKYKPVKKNNWQKEVIDKCKANHGVDCESSRYVQSKRPLTQAERDKLNREREQRRIQRAISESDRYCRGGRC